MKNSQEIQAPIDISEPNPNGEECDDLYLDMNGIIHPCCHPEDKPAPETENEMYAEIFHYIDRIVNMMRPRKLLFMAIDGVAPRAKINQQRSRRFRAAKDAKERLEREEELRKELTEAGIEVPPRKEHKAFDSNCITPGTRFMSRLTECLRYYIASRLSENSGWNQIKVIISDANVPGEGEHKIMNFIRSQRADPKYDPNTRHVLHGLDADLIMLALATHEPHFKILREDVFWMEGKGCFICKRSGHQARDCTEADRRRAQEEQQQNGIGSPGKRPFIFLHISVLREYLELEFRGLELGFGFDFERIVDDWVFMLFFIGNDFLPHLPSLEIKEGAIDALVTIYKRLLPLLGGYVTENGSVDLGKVQELVIEIGKQEDEVFRRRHERDQRQEQNTKKRKIDEMSRGNTQYGENVIISTTHEETKRVISGSSTNNQLTTKQSESITNREYQMVSLTKTNRLDYVSENSLPEPQPIEERDIRQPIDVGSPPLVNNQIPFSPTADDRQVGMKTSTGEFSDEETKDRMAHKRKYPEEGPEVIEVPKEEDKEVLLDTLYDDVRLWESGWKERYYESKLGIKINDLSARNQIVKSYTEGLCWVMKYYYQGCPSWKWYYPYHYPPFASDFSFISEFEIAFELGEPFRPIDQLMGVLPAASGNFVPEPMHHLMLSESSPIKDYYPEDFQLDLNGKKHAWQGVALLPFVDEHRLLAALETVYDRLTPEELERNKLGNDVIFVSQTHRLFIVFLDIHESHIEMDIKLDTRLSGGITGFIKMFPQACLPGQVVTSPLPTLGFPDLNEIHCMSLIYKLPTMTVPFKFGARLLPGVQMPPRRLTYEDSSEFYSSRRENRRGRFGTSSSYGTSYYGQNYQQPNHHNVDYPTYQPSTNTYSTSPRSGYYSTYPPHPGDPPYMSNQRTTWTPAPSDYAPNQPSAYVETRPAATIPSTMSYYNYTSYGDVYNNTSIPPHFQYSSVQSNPPPPPPHYHRPMPPPSSFYPDPYVSSAPSSYPPRSYDTMHHPQNPNHHRYRSSPTINYHSHRPRHRDFRSNRGPYLPYRPPSYN